MPNTTRKTKPSTTKTPDTPKPGTVYQIMSPGVQEMIDNTAVLMPADAKVRLAAATTE